MSYWWLLILTCSLRVGVQITWSLVLMSSTGDTFGCNRWCPCAEAGVVLPPFMTSVS